MYTKPSSVTAVLSILDPAFHIHTHALSFCSLYLSGSRVSLPTGWAANTRQPAPILLIAQATTRPILAQAGSTLLVSSRCIHGQATRVYAVRWPKRRKFRF